MTQQQKAFEGMSIPTDNRAKLEAKFIVPPFSVLDTRQGYWQERKRLWVSLGMQSEIGRGELKTNPGTEDTGCGAFGKNYKDRENPDIRQSKKYAVTGGSRLPTSKIGSDGKFARGDLHTGINSADGTGTSIFDPVLCELIYKWFCPEQGIILDPFAGGSVRGIVASILGYTYHGIDLSQRQVEANIEQAKQIVPDKQPVWYVGDSNKMSELLPGSYKADLVFSCPPYHDLEQYTDDMDDLSNMSWDTFKQKYSQIIAQAILKLKDNRFACFVVSEIRDSVGAYKGLVPLTIKAFIAGGMRYYNEAILVNVIGSLPVRVAGQFAYRKLGRTHQNILVFYKGDIDLIPKHFKAIDTGIDYFTAWGKKDEEIQSVSDMPQAPQNQQRQEEGLRA